MILLRWLAMAWRTLREPAAPRLPGAAALPAYVAMGRQFAGSVQLEPRLRLLVTQLAAERSGCRWCMERGRHLWRKAYLSPDLLRALRTYAASPLFSEPERAALAFADAVTRYADTAGGIPADLLTEVRRHFTEPEVAALAMAVALEHFFNPATGALGADAAVGGVTAADSPRRHRVLATASIRNLW